MDVQTIQRLTQRQLVQEFEKDPTSVAALNALSNDWIVTHPDELKKTILAIDEANPQGWAEQAAPLLKRIRAAFTKTLEPERGDDSWLGYLFKQFAFSFKQFVYTSKWHGFRNALVGKLKELHSKDGIDAWILLGFTDTNLFIESLKKMDLPDEEFLKLLENYARASGIEEQKIPGTLLLLVSAFKRELIEKCLEKVSDPAILHLALEPIFQRRQDLLDLKARFPDNSALAGVCGQLLFKNESYREIVSEMEGKSVEELEEALLKEYAHCHVDLLGIALKTEHIPLIAECLKKGYPHRFVALIQEQPFALFIEHPQIGRIPLSAPLALLLLEHDVLYPFVTTALQTWLYQHFPEEKYAHINIALHRKEWPEQLQKCTTAQLRETKAFWSDKEVQRYCELLLFQRETFREIAVGVTAEERFDALVKEYAALQPNLLRIALQLGDIELATVCLSKCYGLEYARLSIQENKLIFSDGLGPPFMLTPDLVLLLLQNNAIPIPKNRELLMSLFPQEKQLFIELACQNEETKTKLAALPGKELLQIRADFAKRADVVLLCEEVLLVKMHEAIREKNKEFAQDYVATNLPLTKELIEQAIKEDESIANLFIRAMQKCPPELVKTAYDLKKVDLCIALLKKSACPKALMNDASFIAFLQKKLSLEQMSFLFNSISFAYTHKQLSALIALLEKRCPIEWRQKKQITAFLKEKWEIPHASIYIDLLLGEEKAANKALQHLGTKELEKILEEQPISFPRLYQLIDYILLDRRIADYTIPDAHYTLLPQIQLPEAPKSLDLQKLPEMFRETLQGIDLEQEVKPYEEGQSYSFKQLHRQLQLLITFCITGNATERMDRVALPAGEQRITWFHQYQNILRLIMQELLKENNPDLVRECLSVLAISQQVCATGRMQQAISVYEYLSRASTENVENRVFAILKSVRNQVIDELAGFGEENVHQQEGWRKTIGKERGIVGSELLISAYALDLDKSDALNQFDAKYTPRLIVEKMRSRLPVDEKLRFWFYEHRGEKYKDLEMYDLATLITDPDGRLTIDATLYLLETMGLLRLK